MNYQTVMHKLLPGDHSMNSRTQKGFTLVELMIAVAIIAILAAIAIPAYKDYIATSRNVEGANNLASIAIAQEEFFLENNTYFSGATTNDLINNSMGLWQPAERAAADRNFDYAVAAGDTGTIATSFKATATGNGKQVPTTVVLEKKN